MSNQKHNGGLHETVSEIGFGVVKFFEGEITASGITLDIVPPANRLLFRNADVENPVYINVNGGIASTVTSLIPGDNIKVVPEGILTMDFDNLKRLSIIAASVSGSLIEGTLAWKGVA